METNVTYEQSRLLFRTLTANGLFSTVSGLVMLVFSSPVAAYLGLPDARWLFWLGIVLIGFGGAVLFHGYRKRVRRAEAIAISALDLGWVLGSALILLLAPGLFTTAGIVAVLVVAAIVLTFFELQVYALWQTRPAITSAAGE